MGPEQLTPDQVVYWQWGFFKLNATIVYTWAVMAILVIGSALVTRKLSSGRKISRWQNLLEVVVGYMRREIRQLSYQNPDPYLPFVGTLFIFIAVSNVLGLVPGFMAPTGSLSTAAALAACVFVAVPLYGIANQGVVGYLKRYVKPTPFMLPFNLIGELSRTLALAIRLFGNVMSGAKIVAVLLMLVPFILPVVMSLLGLLIGLIQAYVFAVLAMVYISSGMRVHQPGGKGPGEKTGGKPEDEARESVEEPGSPETEKQSQERTEDIPEKGSTR